MSDQAVASATFLVDPAVSDPVFDFAAVSEGVRDEEGLDQEMGKAIGRFGIEHFVFYQATDRDKRPSGARISGRSLKAWRNHYMESGLADEDELLRSGLTSHAPTTWTKFRAQRPMTAPRVYDEARAFGLQDGFYLPLLRADGSLLGVSMMSPHKLEAGPRMLAAVHMLALYYSFAAERLGTTPREAPTSPKRTLTRRQLECLSLVGAGKSAWEVGETLKLSEHTVNEHLGAARKRLKVHTTTQAVILAARRGQIVL